MIEGAEGAGESAASAPQISGEAEFAECAGLINASMAAAPFLWKSAKEK